MIDCFVVSVVVPACLVGKAFIVRGAALTAYRPEVSCVDTEAVYPHPIP